MQGTFDRVAKAWSGGGFTALDLNALGPRARALVLMIGGVCAWDDLRVASANDDGLLMKLGLSDRELGLLFVEAQRLAARPAFRVAVEDLARELDSRGVMDAVAFRRWLVESKAAWNLPANKTAHGPGHAKLAAARRAAFPATTTRERVDMSAGNGHSRDDFDLDFLEGPGHDEALREFDLDWSFERNYGEQLLIPRSTSGKWSPAERRAALDAVDRRVDRLHDLLDE